ncbi:transcription termination factor Rho [Coprococcus sp. CAG:782]|nr:transcription termination factor Rho [Coprococcus sp. CAG:782]
MDFNNASLAELRQYVKANGIKGTSAMKKKELAEYLIEREQNNGDIKSATSEKTNNNQKKKVEKIRKEKNTIEKNMEMSEASEEKNIAGGYVDESFRTGSEQNVTYNDMTSVTDKGEASDGTLHIDVESGDGRYRQDNGRRLRNTVRNYRGRVDNRGDNRYDNHVEARRDVYRADHKSDPRTDYRQDRRTDSRNDNRYDNRNDNRYDNRNDNRYDNRNDNRYDNRYDNRAESRVEIKYDNRTDSRCENRQDNRYDGRADNRTDSRYDNSDIQPPTPENNEALYNELDSGKTANGILEVMPEGFGFIRSANYMPGDQDIYVSPAQIRRLGLKTGDIISGSIRVKTQGEKFSALLYVNSVNDLSPETIAGRKSFEDLTPIFPNERIVLDGNNSPVPIRMIDLLAPIGKGQRGMIVSPPKTGKTTLIKQIAKCISTKYTDMHLLVLLIDERPEEVTDIRESIEGPNVEVIYSTFDELPEHHKRVSEMVIERAKRLVEQKKDVVILLDSITRLARAYNLTVQPSGRTLSGGLDPAALHMPKKFFGAARNMREGGSLTILATALVETGSKMDDVVFEEFKGTGNMELVLDRKLSEKRIFPAIDIARSGTRRDDLLLSKKEQEIVTAIHKALLGNKSEDVLEDVLKLFVRTKNNEEFMYYVEKSILRH